MAFTVEHFHDLVRLLEEREEWRRELRRLLWTDELLALPGEFAVYRAETDRRFAELAEALQATQQEVRALAEALQATQQEVRALAEALQATQQEVRALAEALQATQQEVRALAEAQRVTQEEVRTLSEAVKVLVQDVSVLKDHDLVRRYRERGAAYFGERRFRRIRALDTEELMAQLEDALDTGRISLEDYEEAREIDLVLQGRWEGNPLCLALEISWAVDPKDIERAVKRAEILSKILGNTRPGVAGARLTWQAEEVATKLREEGIPLVIARDGQIDWPS
ncbi:MAG: hypothetical protein N0A15_11745 [Anaerolineae bacterium]|nr:hypothetical protein [Anaerolineae bacterium]